MTTAMMASRYGERCILWTPFYSIIPVPSRVRSCATEPYTGTFQVAAAGKMDMIKMGLMLRDASGNDGHDNGGHGNDGRGLLVDTHLRIYIPRLPVLPRRRHCGTEISVGAGTFYMPHFIPQSRKCSICTTTTRGVIESHHHAASPTQKQTRR